MSPEIGIGRELEHARRKQVMRKVMGFGRRLSSILGIIGF
jgi:hypothetical protein